MATEQHHVDDFKSLTALQVYNKAFKFLQELDLSAFAWVLNYVQNYAKDKKAIHIHLLEDQIINKFANLLVMELNELPIMRDIYRNLLFIGAYKGHYEIVDSILRFYHQFKKHFSIKPWLVTDNNKRTPLHVALVEQKDECAYCILSSIDDREDVCNLVDSAGNTPLFLAVKHGCNKSALYILNNVSSPNFNGEHGSTALHFANNSSEEVFTHLLDHMDPTCINTSDENGNTVLHKWIELKNAWPLDYVFGESGKQDSISPESNKYLMDLIYAQNTDGNNPFHIAAKNGLDQVCQILAKIHKQRLSLSSSNSDDHVPKMPWLIPNKKEEMPLGLAITSDENCVESVDEFNSLRAVVRSIKKALIQGDHDLLFKAIEMKKFNAADAIWDLQDKYGWSMYGPHRDMWLAALKYSDEEVAIWMAGRLSDLFSNPDDEFTSTLFFASKNGKARLIEYLLKKNPSALRGDQSKVWIEACRNGHCLAVKAFIENCKYFRKLCIDATDSPLHNVEFETEEEYKDILKIPTMWSLKNFQDSNGNTPLHTAIKDRKILLAKLLLNTNGVVRTIEDNEGKTALDLLLEVCNTDWRWDEMCNDIGIVPGLQMTYFGEKTDLFAVRDSLLVVASLLATITFAAGFQLPGGMKSDNSGKAAIGDKIIFCLFLLSDTVAMCCSMLAVVSFLWSTVCEEYNRALLLIDRSVPVMAVALSSTLVAFMTGVYVVMPTKSHWVAILVLVLCSIVIFMSGRCIMHKFFDLIYPQLGRDYKRRDYKRIKDLEEGETSTSVRQ